MKGIVKAVIAGCIIIGIGVAILLLALGLNGWTFTPNYQMTTYSTEDEEITTPVDTVKLNFKAGKIKTEFYDGEFITVKYPKIENYNTDIEVADGVLSFTGPNKLHWYSFPLGWGNLPETVIKLPQNTTFNLDFTISGGTATINNGTIEGAKIVMNAGKITVSNVAVNSTFECTMNAGAAEMENVTCNGSFDFTTNFGGAKINRLTCNDITLNTNAGGIELNILGIKSDYTVTIDNSVAGCNIEEQVGTTDKTLTIETNAGGIEVEFVS